MKKFIQISLIVVFVLASFQVAVDGSLLSVSTAGSSATSAIFSTVSTPLEGVHATACLVYIKGVVCVKPLVGWNS
jgi:hypothetical protein